ncbi:MAG TPA: Kazal-type serine protease inhibitor domain-containing protein [Cytophagales bacterium]|nr:Kazal-type serine protease inhibitor domain-containing protein [Cytophagales bacterium]
MKLTLAIFTITVTLLSSCDYYPEPNATSSENCFDARIQHYEPCDEVYEPVCGCDEIVYSNPCEAEKAGIVSYTFGDCSKTFRPRVDTY